MPCQVPSIRRPPLDGYRQIYARKHRTDMGGHVVRSLKMVAVTLVPAMRGEARNGVLQVQPHVRIRVFLNCKRGRGVLAKQCQQSVFGILRAEPIGNRARDHVQPGPGGFNLKRARNLSQVQLATPGISRK